MDNEEDELVFEGEELTWGATARAIRIDDSTYDTRAKRKQPAISAPEQVEKGKGRRKKESVGGSSSAFRLRDEEKIGFDHLGQDEEKEFNEKIHNLMMRRRRRRVINLLLVCL